jgi:hypothetical protein
MACLSYKFLSLTVFQIVSSQVVPPINPVIKETQELYRNLKQFECPSDLVGKTRLVDHGIKSTYQVSNKMAFTGRAEVCLPLPESIKQKLKSVILIYSLKINVDINVWGTICFAPDEYTAHSMCASLHYSNLGKMDEVLSPEDIDGVYKSANKSQLLFMNNLVCVGGIYNDLTECTYDLENEGRNACKRKTDVYLKCGKRDYKPFICPSGKLGKTRLVDHKNRSTYAESNKSAWTGRVEVCQPLPPSIGISLNVWGTICHAPDKDTAHSMCASLHYSKLGRMKSILRSEDISDVYNPAEEDQPTLMNNLACKAATLTNLRKCEYDLENRGKDSCKRETDVYLTCEERQECLLCRKSEENCNFEVMFNTKERCNAQEIFCVFKWTIFDDEEIPDVTFMGCSDEDCWTFLNSCKKQTDRKCYCHDCKATNCTAIFLDMYRVNSVVIATPFASFMADLMGKFNFLMRLLLLDFSALASLF